MKKAKDQKGKEDFKSAYSKQRIKGVLAADAKRKQTGKELDLFQNEFQRTAQDVTLSDKLIHSILKEVFKEKGYKLPRSKYYRFKQLIAPDAIEAREKMRRAGERIAIQNEQIAKLFPGEYNGRIISFVVGKKDKRGVYQGFSKGDREEYTIKKGKKISKGVATGSRKGGKTTKEKNI